MKKDYGFLCAVLIGGVWGMIANQIGMSPQKIEFWVILLLLNVINVVLWIAIGE